MKYLILITFNFTLTSAFFAQTTETEYNYLTKGYKIQVETGLDMKKGYSIKNYGKWGTDYSTFQRNVTFKGLYRDGEESPCAVLMIFNKTDNDYVAYFCIPHIESSKEIWNKAFQDWQKIVNNWGSGAGYSWAMINFMSFAFSK